MSVTRRRSGLNSLEQGVGVRPSFFRTRCQSPVLARAYIPHRHPFTQADSLDAALISQPPTGSAEADRSNKSFTATTSLGETNQFTGWQPGCAPHSLRSGLGRRPAVGQGGAAEDGRASAA